MSKAFTKETDYDDSDTGEKPEIAIPAGSKNYITPVGFKKLQDELKDLLRMKRPEVVQAVSTAAANGDRSENGDYIYGKRKLREIDKRIRFLQKRIEAAEVVDTNQQNSNRVLFGAIVTVENEAGKQIIYRIVGIDESNPEKKEVSWISPIAKALLNSKVGDVITFRSPKGEEELEILRIQY